MCLVNLEAVSKVFVHVYPVGQCDSPLPLNHIVFAGGGLFMNPHVQQPSELFSFSHVCNASRLEDVGLGALHTAISSSKGIKGTIGEQVTDMLEGDSDVASQEFQGRVSLQTTPCIVIGLPMVGVSVLWDSAHFTGLRR